MPRAKVDHEGLQSREQEDPQQSYLSEAFAAALGAALTAFKAGLDRLVLKAGEYARNTERAFDAITLLTKEEAAKRMSLSIATLDRKVAKGEIEVTYLDRRVRFKLTEVQRFIELRTGRSDRKRRRV